MKKAAIKAWEYIGMLGAAVPLAFILMRAFLVPDRLRGNIPAITIVAAAALAVLMLLFYGRRMTHITLAAMAAGLVLLLIWLWRSPQALSRFHVDTLIPVLFYLLVGGSALAVFLLSRTRPGLAALFLAGAGAGCVMGLIGYPVSTAAYMTLLGSTAALFISRQFGASVRRFPHVDLAHRYVAAVAAGLTALAVAASAGAFLLTDRITPIRLTASRDKISAWLQGKTDQTTTGFSGSGSFGGTLRPNGTPVMDVRTDGPVYLKGKSFTTYTGHGWDKDFTPASDQYVVTFDQLVASPLWMPGYLYSSDPAAFRSLPPLRQTAMLAYYRGHDTGVSLQDMTVTLKSASTYLFLPEGYMETSAYPAAISLRSFGVANPFAYIDLPTGRRPVGLLDNVYDFVISGPVPTGTTYTVTAPRYDRSSTAFQTAADAGETDFRDMVEEMAGYYSDAKLADGYGKIYDTLREKYSQPDAAVTARTRQLAQRLTRNCRTDTEKVEAIQSYLAGGFTYTLNPKIAPAGRDFLDYFLFSGKEGYCVHFATAMTVLLRCAGVPARYVEGYVTPSAADEGVYHITENQAHAWVEVYSSLLGWYSVEATPGFAYAENVSGGEDAEGSSSVSSQAASQAASQESSPAASAASAASSAPRGGKRAAPIDWQAPVSAAAAAAAVLLLIVPARLGLRRLRLRRLRKRPAGEQVMGLYGVCLRDLGRLGLGRRPDETPQELARRAGAVLPLGEWDFRQVARIFDRVRYGGGQPTDAELEYIRRFCGEFPRICRRYAGRLRCLIHGIG